MSNDLVKINRKLLELLCPERGYFGRVFTWGKDQQNMNLSVMNYQKIFFQHCKICQRYKEEK
ncbi:MAG: hypothetical protein A3I88_03260 [Candidatus Portnoybacteria bacterium RIFCSPLOWO2_12_FULL_39_9]|uniref:Uncharacterized protein n=1 Tax=Candidatus Portnoybacteria bacterium RIFCSPHIGHO2_12_FULL_38_9 TaxID=1801997 RepID=A0A1G2FG11_9BACT|nr:MAG: hypothetical protein A3H00_00810 [Candidatus Portnoybacteria bacterium RBG_13_40_8]OGZ36053.1 MAG: hypothetical protein A2646_00865 [Candidatus Portnoybacteria bacterium RIFCSPHIGHO2_02_FULL_39_12]OGZ36742.1 MAG: hypothetical protein A3J64_03365 [Candidatus Portnoybacteria bacterium RIFCSPHIGHO2_12_FULL_38_9]OGZ38101.1 MAG: hypothetical protein A3F21_00965 [Candidatus Portnoybacteria bacterium RIFCSPLOWO2_01_FULL_38_39]OGZ40108.1 MAG: hypothetical protein A3I88_03260 [Candidatus Portnoy